MLKVRCECGHEILLLPDLKEMDKAIEDHVEFHLLHDLKKPSCTAAKAERLRKSLIAQVLRLASQAEEENDL
jgi:hypothetical protein